MKHKLLKSLLGKFICKNRRVSYCHIDRVVVVDGNKAIATAIAKTLNGRVLHWFIEVAWSTDCNGFHDILDYKILKEDELDGYTAQDQAL